MIPLWATNTTRQLQHNRRQTTTNTQPVEIDDIDIAKELDLIGERHQIPRDSDDESDAEYCDRLILEIADLMDALAATQDELIDLSGLCM